MNKQEEHDHRVLLSSDDFYMAIYEAMDGCEEGVNQVYEVTESNLEEEYGEDGYVLTDLSEQEKKAVFNLIAEAYEDHINSKNSGWNGFKYSDIDVFESLPLLSDNYIPDREDVEPSVAVEQPVKVDDAVHYDEEKSTKRGRRKFEAVEEESNFQRCTRLQREELHHQFDVQYAIKNNQPF